MTSLHPGIRLEPHDEYMHAVDGAATFNESMYVNVFDPERRLGGFLRLGNRPLEGHAELTVCLFLPDGRVGFWFDRPQISGNEAFDAGGMRIDVVEPFTELTWAYAGKALLLDDPGVLDEPKTAFTSSPRSECRAELTIKGLSPMLGGEPTEEIAEPHGGAFAKGHYEQHVAVRGRLQVGEQEWEVGGYGLRDHSWGPRTWQAPWWYRWLTANFGPDRGFVASVIAARDGSRTVGGVLFEDGAYSLLREVSVDTDWSGDPQSPQRVRLTAATRHKTMNAEGVVHRLVPLRNRRRSPDGELMVTRIAEGATEWRWDGAVGFGMSEYLDQMVDGVPAGLL